MDGPAGTQQLPGPALGPVCISASRPPERNRKGCSFAEKQLRKGWMRHQGRLRRSRTSVTDAENSLHLKMI